MIKRQQTTISLKTFVIISILAVVTIGCAGPPVVSDVTLVPNPNKNAPLAGILTFKSDRPVVPTLYVTDGQNEWTVTPDTEAKTAHEVLVLGLRPDRKHRVITTIQDESNNMTTLDTLEIETPPLPDDFPPIEIIQPATNEAGPGVTMVQIFRWNSKFEDDYDWGLLVGVDKSGEVVWYLKTDFGLGEARRMYSGNLFLGGRLDGRQYEVDMLGNFLQEWHSAGVVLDSLQEGSIAVDTDNFHHDVIQISNGDFIALGLEVISYDDFPTEYPPSKKRGPANVAGDVIIQYDGDGNTVRKYSVVDILDPERLGSGSLQQGFYERLYGHMYDPLPYDITHSNALYYVEEEDALIVSANFQCAIYKVDMKTGELLWILGDPEGWKEPWSDKLLQPKGELIWPCHQHGIEMTPRGTLLVFDNGGGRNIPPQEAMNPAERFSRAVEYHIDDVAGTVEEVWSYGPEQEEFCSPFISDADYLPETGNVLITDGGRFRGPDGNVMNTFGGHQWGRILEVTYEGRKKVWEIKIEDPEVRYSLYRSQRFKSLYPKLDIPTG